MCRPTTCKVCKKTTWAGCGQHIDSVKASVPAGNWCDGKHTDAEKAAANPPKSASESAGFFAKMFGR